MASATDSGAQPADMNAVAPLTPNGWLRYDLVMRMMPDGVTDVLEVGCGQGAFGARLTQGYRYVGVEPDEESCAVARRRLEAAGAGEVRNATVEEVGEGLFDLVCAFEVLEHIEDDAAALRQWARRLRPGGWLLLSVPADQHRYGAADTLVGHFRRYDPEALTALFEECGLGEVEIRRYGFPLGYALEAARNAIAGRRLAAAADTSTAERTAGSGRWLQPAGGLRGAVTQWGTAPLRTVQRAFPGHGPGLVARARLRR